MNTLKLTNEEVRQLLRLVQGACYTRVIDMDDQLNYTVYDQIQQKILRTEVFGTSDPDEIE